jgi:hypothetical protein
VWQGDGLGGPTQWPTSHMASHGARWRAGDGGPGVMACGGFGWRVVALAACSCRGHKIKSCFFWGGARCAAWPIVKVKAPPQNPPQKKKLKPKTEVEGWCTSIDIDFQTRMTNRHAPKVVPLLRTKWPNAKISFEGGQWALHVSSAIVASQLGPPATVGSRTLDYCA